MFLVEQSFLLNFRYYPSYSFTEFEAQHHQEFVVGYWIYLSLCFAQTIPELNSFNWKKVFLLVVFSHWNSNWIDTHCFFLLYSLRRLGFFRASSCFAQRFSFQISLFQSSIAFARVNLSLHFFTSTCSKEHAGRVL